MTLKTEEFYINMGPQHPSMHGVLRLLVKLDGEYIVDCEPVIGYLHRSIEKMAEGKHFGQFIPVTDRLDYVTSMSANYVFVLAVERLADIVPTPRGDYIRVLMVELNRIASHLLWFGTNTLELGATTPFLYAFQEREKILDMFEATCGQRLTYNYLRLGGVAYDLPKTVSFAWTDGVMPFEKACEKFLNEMIPVLDMCEELVSENAIFLKRTRGVGVLPRDLAVDAGCSGPVIRACGVKYDVRKAVPYSIYSELDFDIPTRENGDSWDRYKIRMDEIRESTKICHQVLAKMPKGAFKQVLPNRIWVPPGEVYSRIENSRGDMGTYLVADGSEKSYRCKFRTPSFSNLCVMPYLLKGALVADLIAIGASLDFVLPEIDR
ncbi:MAG: NADH-quinone oxidoreductase subunit D [Armatimonadetes bacterium]|nr:NADH-quinone oxidoreductase subunit D [Armatimonadota bacterium]